MTGIAQSAAFWLALGLGGLCLIAAEWVPSARESRLRTLGVFALRVGAAALPLSAAALAAPGLGDATRGLLVPAILGAAGWLVTYFQALDERDRDQADMMVALRAELWITLNDFRRNDPQVFAAALDARIAQALSEEGDYQPFFPLPSTPLLFDALADRVERLPSVVVERIIQFYSLLADVLRFAEDLRTDSFRELPLPRRRIAYRDYFAMLTTLHRLAARAIVELNSELGLPDPARDIDPALLSESAGGAVSTPAADPSRPGSVRDSSAGTS